jgi:electron transfer flavoprotein beta subunit
MSVDQDQKTIKVRRKLEGYHEVVESRMPVMITVEREINTPRYPTVPGRLDAEEAQVQVWTNNILNLDPNTIGLLGSPTQVRRIFAPEREKGEIIMGEGEERDKAVEISFNKLIEQDFISVQ